MERQADKLDDPESVDTSEKLDQQCLLAKVVRILLGIRSCEMVGNLWGYWVHPSDSFCVPADVRQGGSSGWHTDQQKQQLPDLSTGCAASVQVTSTPLPCHLSPQHALGYPYTLSGLQTA